MCTMLCLCSTTSAVEEGADGLCILMEYVNGVTLAEKQAVDALALPRTYINIKNRCLQKNGRYTSAEEKPTKGMYIVNGKKVVIK